MGLDVGEKRIGVAVSDPLKKTAQALTVIEQSDTVSRVNELKKIIEDLEIDELIVGMPYTLSGEAGRQAMLIQDFAREIEVRTGLPVAFWDERLSTVEAERSLKEAGIKPSKRRYLKDKVAAALILQSYLDRRVKDT